MDKFSLTSYQTLPLSCISKRIFFYHTLNQGCGVGRVACFQLELESVFKTAGVGVLLLLGTDNIDRILNAHKTGKWKILES